MGNNLRLIRRAVSGNEAAADELGMEIDDTCESLCCEIEDLRKATKRMLAYIGGEPCECYDEYNQRMPEPCERCRLLRDYKTWFTRIAKAKEKSDVV